MNIEYIPFPAGVKRLRLLGDVPEEFCFREYAVSREQQKKQKAAVFMEKDLPPPMIDGFDEDLVALYTRKRFFGYLGVGVKGIGFVAAYLTDGENWMPVEKRGLYSDMLKRVSAVEGKSCLASLFPKNPSLPFPDWVFPSHTILHDTALSSAALMPRETAFEYLKKFNK